MNNYNTIYKKNIGRNYICLEPFLTLFNDSEDEIPYREDFRIKMVKENHIDGILSTHIQYVNDIPTFCYDITSLQSLDVILENTCLDYSLLCNILSGLYTSLMSCQKYMLDTDKLILNSQNIFLSPDLSKVWLTYYPLYEQSFLSSLRTLFDYLLKNVKHLDEKCVFLAYSIHKECQREDFSIESLCSFQSLLPERNKETSMTHSDINTQNISSLDLHTSLSQNTANLSSVPSVAEPPSVYNQSTLKERTLFSSIKEKFISFKKRLSEDANQYMDNSPSSLSPTHHKDIYSYMENKKKHMQISPGTVILSSPANPDFHSLIYAGTDMESSIQLTHFPFTIGKNDSCDYSLSNPLISRIHARISCLVTDEDTPEFYVEDLNSTNGTSLNGSALIPYEKYTITFGDHITFGHLTYIFR